MDAVQNSPVKNEEFAEEKLDLFIKKATLRLEKKIGELEEMRFNLEEQNKEKTKNLEESRLALMNMLEDVEDSRKALMNILEDVEDARGRAEIEKEKTLLIINNFADCLLVFDKNNKLESINSQAEKFFNVKIGEVVGKKLLDLQNYPLFEEVVVQMAQGELFRREIQFKDKKNSILEASTVPIMERDEKTATLLILHDITREKEVERMKTEFVSLAAHQLRTPLSAIKWTLKMLLDGDLGAISDEQREFIIKTYASNERMINLINDLLDVTRIEEGRYLYKPILSQLEPIVKFVANTYKDEFMRKGLAFSFEEPTEKFPKVKVDIEKIRLVVQNFLDNALRYTPPGGRVTIYMKHDKKEVEVAVQDTGKGVPADQKERVFTKFFRAANVMRLDTEGSGLGLYISKNIVEAHGGRIWFDSEENKGAIFHFTLPASGEFEEFLKTF